MPFVVGVEGSKQFLKFIHQFALYDHLTGLADEKGLFRRKRRRWRRASKGLLVQVVADPAILTHLRLPGLDLSLVLYVK